MMSQSTQLARYLHEQLVLKYTFANLLKPFQMRYSTIQRDSGLLDGYSRQRAAIDALDAAFCELKEHEVIRTYERKDETGPHGKLNDVVFAVHPSFEFVGVAKAANKRQIDGQLKNAPKR